MLVHEIVGLLESKIAEVSRNPSVKSLIDALSSLTPDGSLRVSLEAAVRRHIAPGTSPAAIEHAINEVANELSHPGSSSRDPSLSEFPSAM